MFLYEYFSIKFNFKKFHVQVLLTSFVAFFSAVTPAFADASFNQVLLTLKYESLKSQISAQHFHVADGLNKLNSKSEFASHFKNYTLVKNSLSLQPSSPSQPRAILFGSTAKLIMTFNADHMQSGGHSLEIAEFDEIKNTINFREIIFKDELPEIVKQGLTHSRLTDNSDLLKSELSLSISDIEYENSKIAVTKANPIKCLSCHSASFAGESRYIWDSYEQWPGLYGEKEDVLSTEEQKSLASFKTSAITHDRYKYLDGNLDPYFPYFVGIPKTGRFFERPNLRLTQLIAINQAKVLAKIFRSQLTQEEITVVTKQLKCKKPSETFEKWLSTWPFDLEFLMALDNKTLTSLYKNLINIGDPDLFRGQGLRNLVKIEFLRQSPETKTTFDQITAYNLSSLGKDRLDDFGHDDDLIKVMAAHFTYDLNISFKAKQLLCPE